MIIDVTDGSIRFESGSIEPGTFRNAFLKSGLGSNAEILVNNEPYVTYRIRPEIGIAATVSFVGDRLTGIAWLHLLPPDKEREWTEVLELERKKLHDEWLLDQLGAPPYRYHWGQISSEYDPKGCVSDIILNYAK